ncbi:MAG: ribbon-helix-helix domain-containing protein [Candidatus Aminicenantes bacterium]|nr:ribbon-helix-helix domain-containing protein [Candidatus Aminicenantes bacterium]
MKKMRTLTLKIPEMLEAKLDAFARKRGQNRSEIVRHALAQYFSSDGKIISGTFLDLSGDLAGCIEGPSDLSFNKSHLDGYGT